MNSIRFFLLATACMLASCGGGGGGADPAPEMVTFSFRLQGSGEEQEFRYATSSEAFIAMARSQLSLPVLGRTRFPIGPIAAGSGGVNLNWNWHFNDLSFTDTAIELCDGTPAMVEADLPYWLNTVKNFCPWRGYVYAEVTGTYPLKRFAVGETRDIAQENIRIEFKDLVDSRCPAAASCISAGHAEVELAVRVGTGSPQPLTVTLGAGERDQQAVLAGLLFTLDALNPFPVAGPASKDQYRADITVRKTAMPAGAR